jgi:hypothetical protein
LSGVAEEEIGLAAKNLRDPKQRQRHPRLAVQASAAPNKIDARNMLKNRENGVPDRSVRRAPTVLRCSEIR